MGLDVSPGGARWSYGGFHQFRLRLVWFLGLAEPRRDGAPLGSPLWSWRAVPDSEPLAALLNHSDCDGELSPKECAVVAPRLRAMVELWDDDDYDKQQALRLLDGMAQAVKTQKPLVFG